MKARCLVEISLKLNIILFQKFVFHGKIWLALFYTKMLKWFIIKRVNFPFLSSSNISASGTLSSTQLLEGKKQKQKKNKKTRAPHSFLVLTSLTLFIRPERRFGRFYLHFPSASISPQGHRLPQTTYITKQPQGFFFGGGSASFLPPLIHSSQVCLSHLLT